jgi:hypothetical protein
VQRRVGYDGVERSPLKRMGQHVAVAPDHIRVWKPRTRSFQHWGV